MSINDNIQTPQSENIPENQQSSENILTNSLKEDFKLREIEYKQKIKELEEELNKENNQMVEQKKASNEEMISKLRVEIKEKDKEIKKYLSINTNQRKELENLSKEIDNKLKTMNFRQLTDRIKKERTVIKSKAPEDAIKVKETQLKNALNLVDILTKDNKRLKDMYKVANDFQGKYELIDKSKEADLTISSLNLDLQKLKRQLEEHTKCPKIKNDLEKKLILVKNDRNNIISKINGLKEKIKNSDVMYNKGLEVKEVLKEETIKKNKIKKTMFINENAIDINAMQNDQDFKTFVELFTEDEVSMIIKAFTDNKKEFIKFIKKISNFESQKKSKELRHKIEIKNFENKIQDLNEQIQFLNLKNLKSADQYKVLSFQFNDYQNDQKAYNRKIKELQNLIESIRVIHKQKDSEILNLSKQLNEVKNVIKNTSNDDKFDEIQKYIIQVKNNNSNNNKEINNINNVDNMEDFNKDDNNNNDEINVDDVNNENNEINENNDNNNNNENNGNESNNNESNNNNNNNDDVVVDKNINDVDGNANDK